MRGGRTKARGGVKRKMLRKRQRDSFEVDDEEDTNVFARTWNIELCVHTDPFHRLAARSGEEGGRRANRRARAGGTGERMSKRRRRLKSFP